MTDPEAPKSLPKGQSQYAADFEEALAQKRAREAAAAAATAAAATATSARAGVASTAAATGGSGGVGFGLAAAAAAGGSGDGGDGMGQEALEVLGNAVPWRAREVAAAAAKGGVLNPALNPALNPVRSSMDDDAVPADARSPFVNSKGGFGVLSSSSGGSGSGSSSCGGPSPVAGSGFMKPHVSVMMGRQGSVGAGSKRGKGRASARGGR